MHVFLFTFIFYSIFSNWKLAALFRLLHIFGAFPRQTDLRNGLYELLHDVANAYLYLLDFLIIKSQDFLVKSNFLVFPLLAILSLLDDHLNLAPFRQSFS